MMDLFEELLTSAAQEMSGARISVQVAGRGDRPCRPAGRA